MFKLPHFDRKQRHVYDNYLRQDEKSEKQVTFMKENRVFGFSIYFLVFLIVTKLLYIVVEMVYNSIVLDGNSTLGLSLEELQNIEHLGLLVSTTGLVLLIQPLIYKVSLYFTLRDARDAILRMIFIAISSFFLYLVTYNSFQAFTDYLISQAKEERYDAYYLTMLKEGFLNNILSYSSFIVDRPSEDGQHPFSVQDKVVGLNLYLLLFVDEHVIQKMVDEGAENVYRLRLKEFIAKDYPEKEAKIINLSARVRYFWHKYNRLKEDANQALSEMIRPEKIRKDYESLMERLHEEYELYHYDNENFKNTITLSIDGDVSPKTSDAGEWKKRHGDVEMNLNSFDAYIDALSVKEHIIELAKKRYHVKLGYGFDGSFKSFKKYYLNSLDFHADSIIRQKVEKKLQKYGVRNAALDYDWDTFISLPFIEELLQKRIPDAKLRAQVLSIIKARDIKRFYSEVYLPHIEKLIRKSVFISKERFDEDPKAKKFGDDALRLLYIPPLAIFFSSLFGVLNFIIMVVYAIYLYLWIKRYRHRQLGSWSILGIKSSLLLTKLFFAALFIYVPIQLSEGKSHDYPILNRLFNEDAQDINKPFLYTMQWLLTTEPMIYKIGQSTRKMLPPKLLEHYGISHSKAPRQE